MPKHSCQNLPLVQLGHPVALLEDTFDTFRNHVRSIDWQIILLNRKAVRVVHESEVEFIREQVFDRRVGLLYPRCLAEHHYSEPLILLLGELG